MSPEIIWSNACILMCPGPHITRAAELLLAREFLTGSRQFDNSTVSCHHQGPIFFPVLTQSKHNNNKSKFVAVTFLSMLFSLAARHLPCVSRVLPLCILDPVSQPLPGEVCGVAVREMQAQTRPRLRDLSGREVRSFPCIYYTRLRLGWPRDSSIYNK